MTSFQEQLEQIFFQSSGENSLKAMRIKAWDRFLTLGLPESHSEGWGSVKLRKLFMKNFDLASPELFQKKEIASYLLPGCEERCLVFVNGCYQKELSRLEGLEKEVQVFDLEEASSVYGSFFNHYWVKSIKEEKDPFAALNAALGKKGLFLYVPPKRLLERPIQILHLIDAPSPIMAFPRIHVLAGAHAQCQMIFTPHLLSEGHWVNQCVEILAEDGAQIRLWQKHTGLNPLSWYFEAYRVQLKRDSFLKTVAFSKGAETSRMDYKVLLAGENSEADLRGLSFLDQKRESHIHILMDHQAPYCRSNQLFKSVLKDLSRTSFEGKIYVQQEAQKTQAFQLNNNLLLSEGAIADSKPNLEIFADDVKASHGATVGQLDPEHMFYLKTRGFSSSEAEEILIKGFCQEILDEMYGSR